MGKALHVITGGVTNLFAAFQPAVPIGTDSYTIRQSNGAAKVRMISAWGNFKGIDTVNIASPLMHDQINPLQFLMPVGEVEPFFKSGFMQPVFPEDTLQVGLITVAGAATDVTRVSLLMHYEDAVGIDAQLFNWSDIKDKILNLKTIHVTCTSLATGQYGIGIPLNAAANVGIMKGNTKYALLGYRTNLLTCTIGITGPDTGNVRIAGPGNLNQRSLCEHWFKDLSEKTGLPCIPVINSVNAPNTIVDVVHDEVAAARIISLLFAELSA